MAIVGGLDIHRKQLTFDYPGTATGEVRRGQIAPADREHLRAWLARFAGRDDVAFAVEGCTGWRYVAEELAAAGVAAHVGEPADTAAARGRKRHATTGKTDSARLRRLLAEGRLPQCWVPPAQILEYRALLETCHDLRREHTAWVQRIHAVLFHQGAPALGEGALRTEQGLAALQVATAVDMLAAIEARMEVLRTQPGGRGGPPQVGRDERLDRLAGQVGVPIAKHLRYPAVDQDQLAIAAGQRHPVGERVDELAQHGLGDVPRPGPAARPGCRRLASCPRGTAERRLAIACCPVRLGYEGDHRC